MISFVKKYETSLLNFNKLLYVVDQLVSEAQQATATKAHKAANSTTLQSSNLAGTPLRFPSLPASHQTVNVNVEGSSIKAKDKDKEFGYNKVATVVVLMLASCTGAVYYALRSEEYQLLKDNRNWLSEQKLQIDSSFKNESQSPQVRLIFEKQIEIYQCRLNQLQRNFFAIAAVISSLILWVTFLFLSVSDAVLLLLIGLTTLSVANAAYSLAKSWKETEGIIGCYKEILQYRESMEERNRTSGSNAPIAPHTSGFGSEFCISTPPPSYESYPSENCYYANMNYSHQNSRNPGIGSGDAAYSAEKRQVKYPELEKFLW